MPQGALGGGWALWGGARVGGEPLRGGTPSLSPAWLGQVSRCVGERMKELWERGTENARAGGYGCELRGPLAAPAEGWGGAGKSRLLPLGMFRSEDLGPPGR